jgi:ABC-type glutathione transport system ATPase component
LVTIRPTNLNDTGGLDQAFVEVAITDRTVSNVLAVPVTAVLALSGSAWSCLDMHSEQGSREPGRFAAPNQADADGPRVVLEVERVSNTYRSGPPVNALQDVSLTVTAGELVAVVGPSGSGKTTLLHVMGSLDRPSAGTVKITGLDLLGLSDRQLAVLRAGRVGFVFQQFFLAEHASLLDNVAGDLAVVRIGSGQLPEHSAVRA